MELSQPEHSSSNRVSWTGSLIFAVFGCAVFLFAKEMPLGNATFDMHWHDTYYAIGPKDILYRLGIILFVIAGLYLFGSRFLRSRALMILQVLFSFVFLFIALNLIAGSGTMDLSGGGVVGLPRPAPAGDGVGSWLVRARNTKMLKLGLVCLVASLLIFLLHYVTGVLRNRTQANRI